MDILKTISLDLYRYKGKTQLIDFLKAMRIPGFRFMVFYRLVRHFKPRSVIGLLISIVKRHYMFKYGIEIPAQTQIGKGFYIGHFGNIIVNSDAIIGNNCNISQGVTIGAISIGKKRGCPTLQDNIWVGPNACIVGNIRIESNVLIAPGAYVNFDVPANSIVIGNPGVIKTYDSSKNIIEGYVHNPIAL